MPGSVRTLDVTFQRYDPVECTNPSPEQTVIRQAKEHRLTPLRFPPSPADSDVVMREPSPGGSPSATTREERRLIRNIDRGAPGDQAIFSEGKTHEQRELAKRKSKYYGDVFAYRESNTSARERVLRESPVLADVRTNVIIQDEYTFITELSNTLASYYQRPENSIVVTVAHSCCLLFGGNFDPAYTLTINAIPSQLQPVTNKRNSIRLAQAMEDGLGVGPERGLIKFVGIAEENFATDGKTVAGEIEELEREIYENDANLAISLSRTTTNNKRRQSMKSLRSLRTKGQLPTHNESMSSTPEFIDRATPPPMPPMPTHPSTMDQKAEKAKKMGRRRSFMAAMFGRAG